MFNIVPEEILLFTQEDTGGVGFISLEPGQSEAITLVGKSTSPKAVAFDRKQQVIVFFCPLIHNTCIQRHCKE